MYEAFYHLKHKPFQLSPDPRFFFHSKGHKRALSYLRYGIRQGEGFIIVTGDVGTGKTTLAGALFKALERENVVAAQVVTTQLHADDLLRMVAASFGLDYNRVSKAALLRNLEAFFRACMQEGKRVLLVVDEAQNLPRKAIEELRMLSNFQFGGRALLQSFLLGQREFRVTMRSEGFEQLRQRVIAAYHLKPLDEKETRGYIEHRLRTAGWRDDPKIENDVFAGIHRFSDGVPRRINTLCDRFLLYGCLEELHTLDSEALAAVAADIVEEQGASTASRAALAHLRGEEPPQSSPERVEYSEGGLTMKMNVAQKTSAGPDDTRLAAVETNMAALTEAFRQELSSLRDAILDNHGTPKKGE